PETALSGGAAAGLRGDCRPLVHLPYTGLCGETPRRPDRGSSAGKEKEKPIGAGVLFGADRKDSSRDADFLGIGAGGTPQPHTTVHTGPYTAVRDGYASSRPGRTHQPEVAGDAEDWRWMRPKTYLFPGTEKGWRVDRPITAKMVWAAVEFAAKR